MSHPCKQLLPAPRRRPWNRKTHHFQQVKSRYSYHYPLYRLETCNALGFENLYCIGFELVVAGEAFIEADNAFGLEVGHCTDECLRQLPLQADEESAFRCAEDGLAR